jgi:hypothetical protein
MGVEQLLIQIDILLVRLGYNLFTQVGKFNIVIQQDINDCYGDPIADSKVEIFIGEKEFYSYDYLYGKLDYYNPVVSEQKFRELMLLKNLLEDRAKQRKG